MMTKQAFDILDPSLNLYQKFFIEASAGCGKTFSMEHAYLRFLLSPQKEFTVQEILVLTFTKEATKELRVRIRQTIERGIFELENPSQTQIPYLKDLIIQDPSFRESAIRRLLDALANFDQAQIFTLHSFCFRMLKEYPFEAHLNIEDSFQDEGPSLNRVESVLKDFFNTQLQIKSDQTERVLFSASQIRLLLQYFKGDFSALFNYGVYELSKETKVLSSDPYSHHQKTCSNLIHLLQKNEGFEREKILQDLTKTAFQYKGGHTRSGLIKPKLDRAIRLFSELFSKNEHSKTLDLFLWEARTLFDHFQEENLKRRGIKKLEEPLYYPELWNVLNHKLTPLIEKMIDPSYLLAHLINHAQAFYQKVLTRAGILTPHRILLEFQKLVKKEQIAKKIAHRFEAVIVDEFQDTDPIQWEILSSIFLKYRSKNHPFYLVGDPKQSIYAFRRADIYTYLTAAKHLGSKSHQTLNINYRSQPHLIEALNALFEQINKNWLDLPKWKGSLSYEPVQSGSHVPAHDYKDQRQSMHFFLCKENKRSQKVPSKEAEEEKLFPFLVNEILRLHLQEKIPFKSFALLVRDRFQAARLKLFLKKYHIPFQSIRPEPLKESKIASDFLQLYKAILQPKKRSAIAALKLSPYFSLFSDQGDPQKLAQMMKFFASLRKCLFEKGFLPFYTALMQNSFGGLKPLAEHLLSLEEGLFIYLELEQIKDLLLLEEISGEKPDSLVFLLEKLSQSSDSLEENYFLRQNVQEDAVHILTLHMSKGLEFDIVFALGVTSRTLQREDLLPLERENEVLLVPPTYSLEHSKSYYQELNAEKLRQLYVALTRAKQRLYIPAVFAHEVEENKSSPLELFLKRLGLDEEALYTFIKSQPHMSYSILKEEVEVRFSLKEREESLISPTLFKAKLQKSLSHSFTSLASRPIAQAIDLKAPKDFEVEEKTLHTLPAGIETGLLYHKILETVDFQEANLSLDPFLKETPYWPWKKVLEAHLQYLFHFSFKTKESSFQLKNLSSQEIFREVEFLYPIEEDFVLEGCTRKGDFLHGFIDLICKVQGKYYLIDYKTNWLGPCNDDYLYLERAMKEHDYFLQASLYQKALKNYLQLFDKRPFEECFGGTFYLFIRAFSPLEGKESSERQNEKGIFYF